MSDLDELRAMIAWKFDNGTPNNGDIQETIADFEAAHPSCDGCRHWDGEPGSAGVFPCRVSGSFRAPLGLLTEGGFGCIHGRKS